MPRPISMRLFDWLDFTNGNVQWRTRVNSTFITLCTEKNTYAGGVKSKSCTRSTNPSEEEELDWPKTPATHNVMDVTSRTPLKSILFAPEKSPSSTMMCDGVYVLKKISPRETAGFKKKPEKTATLAGAFFYNRIISPPSSPKCVICAVGLQRVKLLDWIRVTQGEKR